MGVEYDLISDSAREGYELGKGPWADLERILRNSSWPANEITSLLVGDKFDFAYAAVVAREIVAFADAHPDWRIIDDCSSDISVVPDADDEELFSDCDFPVYKRVGTRYRRSAP